MVVELSVSAVGGVDGIGEDDGDGLVLLMVVALAEIGVPFEPVSSCLMEVTTEPSEALEVRSTNHCQLELGGGKHEKL